MTLKIKVCLEMGNPDSMCQLVDRQTHREVVGQTKFKTVIKNYLSPIVNVVNAVVIIIMTIMVRAFPTHKRGIFCDDLSIRYPHLPETVSTKVLIACTFVFSVLVFCCGEFLASNFYRTSQEAKAKITKKSFRFWLRNLRQSNAWYLQVMKLLLIFLWGTGLSHILCYILKSSFGHMRPNFWAICNPNITCEAGDRTYHTDYICQSANERQEIRARQAFPSGHATFTGFAALFLIIYAQNRLRPRLLWNHLFILRPLFQATCFSVSLWVCATRVTDYVHHLEDIVVGYALGGVIGLLLGYQTFNWLSAMYAEPCEPNTDPSEMVELKSETKVVDKIGPNNANHTDKDVEKGLSE